MQIWPVNKQGYRTLFYALHRANTTKGFIEGAGVVAVARAEAEAMRFGLPCPEPCVDEAVEGLRRDMLSLGLIWDEPQPDRDRKRRILTNWSLTDDILPRTPATDNEAKMCGSRVISTGLRVKRLCPGC